MYSFFSNAAVTNRMLWSISDTVDPILVGFIALSIAFPETPLVFGEMTIFSIQF